MKDKLIYIMILLITFILVTGAMYYGASNYKNIFALDFASVEPDSLQSKTEKPAVTENKQTAQIPVIAKNDSVKNSLASDRVSPEPADVKISASAFSDSSNAIFEELRKIKEMLRQKDQTAPVQASAPDLTKKNSMKDSVYNKWIKNSVKLYETMDSKKAAKIIQGYNDNIARDIIFSMKKKKAAEIIAEFKPELVNRIISVE